MNNSNNNSNSTNTIKYIVIGNNNRYYMYCAQCYTNVYKWTSCSML